MWGKKKRESVFWTWLPLIAQEIVTSKFSPSIWPVAKSIVATFLI